MSAITDAAGRVLQADDLDPAEMLDLIEAAGDKAGNATWLQFALLACAVRAIDDVPVPFPRDPAAIKALARRLGNDALDRVRAALFGDAAETQVAEIIAAKN